MRLEHGYISANVCCYSERSENGGGNRLTPRSHIVKARASSSEADRLPFSAIRPLAADSSRLMAAQQVKQQLLVLTHSEHAVSGPSRKHWLWQTCTFPGPTHFLQAFSLLDVSELSYSIIGDRADNQVLGNEIAAVRIAKLKPRSG